MSGRNHDNPRAWRFAPASLIMGATLLAPVQAEDAVAEAQSTTHTPSRHFQVQVIDDTVTLQARDVSLGELLGEIARQGGFVIDSRGPLEERTTVELERVPFAEALARLLRGRNFALRHPNPSSPSGLLILADERSGNPVGLERPALFGEHEPLRRALRDGDPGARLEAVAELIGHGDDAAVVVLADVALLDQEPSVREEAVHGLGELGAQADLSILEHALMDPDVGVREAAVSALIEVGGDASARALAIALSDEDASVREGAVDALGEIGGEIATGILQRALTDDESHVREAAAEILARLSSWPR